VVVILLLALPIGLSSPFSRPVLAQENQSDPQIEVQWELKHGQIDNFSQNTFLNLWNWFDEWNIPGGPEVLFSYVNGSPIQVNWNRVNPEEPMQITVRIGSYLFKESDNSLNAAKIQISHSNGSLGARLWLHYWAESDEFHAYSNVYNSTTGERLDDSGIFTLNQTDCIVNYGTKYTDVVFVGTFSTQSPIGEYKVEQLQVRDSFGRKHISNLGTFSGPPWSFLLGSEAAAASMYRIRILNDTLEPTSYAEANDTIIFELSMTTKIGFAIFPLGEVSSAPEYIVPVNWTFPDNSSDPATSWYTQTRYQQPQLGFIYNATTNETQAIIFYRSISFTWIENLSPFGGKWESSFDFIVNNTYLSKFFEFDESESGPINDYAVRWQGHLTNAVGATENPFPTYGSHFSVYRHLPGIMGTRDINGQYPSTYNTVDVELAYHTFIPQLILFNQESDPISRIGFDEPTNFSWMMIGAPWRIEGQNQPFQDLLGDWWRCETSMDNMTLTLNGGVVGENDTHEWSYEGYIKVSMDLDSKAVIDEFCSITNRTKIKGAPDWETVTSLNTSSGLPNLLQLDDIDFIVSENDVALMFQGIFSNRTPIGLYRADLVGWQSVDWYLGLSESGPWQYNHTSDYQKYFHHPFHAIQFSVETPHEENLVLTETGAIDLDGNLETTSDQYYALPARYRFIDGFWGEGILVVNMTFDATPSPEEVGNEFLSESWMGIRYIHGQHNISYDAAFWYHAHDFSRVGSSEMDLIRNLVGENITIPSWRGIMGGTVPTANSSEPIVDDGGYPWFGFGTRQEFNMALDANTSLSGQFRTDFTGFQIFYDSTDIEGGNGVPDFVTIDEEIEAEESTNFFVLRGIEDIEYLSPKLSNGTTLNETAIIGVNESIEFGINLIGVYAIMFPSCSWLGPGNDNIFDLIIADDADGYWGFIPHNPDYSAVEVYIDNIVFNIHYDVLLANTENNPDPYNNLVQMKVDQFFGNWSTRYGELLIPQDIWFQGHALATTYLAELTTETNTELEIDETPVPGRVNTTIVGDIYRFGVENNTIAEVQMGGQEYVWGKDNETYECASAAVPLDVYSSIFESETGEELTLVELESSSYFLLSGFLHWDGYSINNDPIFNTFSSALDMITPSNGESPPPLDYLPLAAIGIATIVVITIVVAGVRVRRRAT
jgi:hypothetical protein